MDKSLDDLIKERPGSGGGGGSMRRGSKVATRPVPYASAQVEKRGRGQFRFDGSKRSDGASIYIGNLSWETTWRELKDHLSLAGEVLRVDVASKPDGQSRGFATAQMGTVRAARAAIATLHESDLMGRTITVREDTGGGGKGGGKGGGGKGGGGNKRGSGEQVEPDDGYSYSGSAGRNGWVKPDGSKFVDEGPPPEPKHSLLR